MHSSLLQSLKPEYAKAATALKAYDADIVIGKVRRQCSTHTAGAPVPLLELAITSQAVPCTLL